MQNVVGPPLVAMATTFGLGAESMVACFVYLFVHSLIVFVRHVSSYPATGCSGRWAVVRRRRVASHAPGQGSALRAHV